MIDVKSYDWPQNSLYSRQCQESQDMPVECTAPVLHCKWQFCLMTTWCTMWLCSTALKVKDISHERADEVYVLLKRKVFSWRQKDVSVNDASSVVSK